MAVAAMPVSGRMGEAKDVPAPPTKMKTIGVLGGIGPQATMDFEARVHRFAQQRVPQRANSGYPPMIVLYHRRPPILLRDDGSPRIPFEPHPDLIEAARRIGPTVDFLVILANGAHVIQKEIERASGRPVLSMVDVTLNEVRKRRWTQVGVLGMGDPVVYTQRLRELGIATEILPAEQRGPLDRAMLRVMEGREDAESRQLAESAVSALRARGVDGVILGCTEIPFLLGRGADEPGLLNPAQLLAEAAVLRALN